MDEEALLEDLLPNLPAGGVGALGAAAFDGDELAEIAHSLMREHGGAGGLEMVAPEAAEADWSDLELRTDRHSVHRIDGTDAEKEYVVSNLR